MVQVGIIMGSDSDLPVMSEAAKVLDSLVLNTNLPSFLLTEHQTKCMNMPLQHRKEV